MAQTCDETCIGDIGRIDERWYLDDWNDVTIDIAMLLS